MIKKINRVHINDVICIHTSALADDFLPNLGKNFLIDYYTNVLKIQDDGKTLMKGYFKSGELVGFFQLSFPPISFHKLITYKVIFPLIHLFFNKPYIFRKGFLQLLNGVALDEKSTEISYLAVSPVWQGKGLGKLLIKDIIKEALFAKKEFIITKTSNKNLSEYYKREFNAKCIKSFMIKGMKYEFLKWKAL